MNIQNAYLTSKDVLSTSILKLTFSASKNLEALPGQYVNIRLAGVWKPYSIAEQSAENEFTIYIKLIKNGTASAVVTAMNIGKTVEFYVSEKIIHNVLTAPTVCIGLGTGVVPLYSIVKYALGSGFKHGIVFLYGAHRMSDYIYSDKLLALEKNYDNLSVKIFLSDNSIQQSGQKKQVAQYLDIHAQDVSDKLFLISAREYIENEIAAKLTSLGVKKGNIYIL